MPKNKTSTLSLPPHLRENDDEKTMTQNGEILHDLSESELEYNKDKKNYSINFDDSSDDEDYEDDENTLYLYKYDISTKLAEFEKQNAERVKNFKQSFVTHALGLQVFYSKAVNVIYRPLKERLLGKNRLLSDKQFTEWLSESLQSAVLDYIKLLGIAASNDIIDDDIILYIANVAKKLTKHKRALLQDIVNNTIGVVLNEESHSLAKEINRIIHEKYLEDEDWVLTQVYPMTRQGLMADCHARFAIEGLARAEIEEVINLLPKTGANDTKISYSISAKANIGRMVGNTPVKQHAIERARKLAGSPAKENFSKDCLDSTAVEKKIDELLGTELRRGDHSIIGNNCKIKYGANLNNSVFSSMVRYQPYNHATPENCLTNFIPEEYIKKIQKAIETVEPTELTNLILLRLKNSKSKAFATNKVKRATIPNGHTFEPTTYSNRPFVHNLLAALRLSNRSSKRLSRTHQENYTTGEQLQDWKTIARSFKFPLHSDAVTETQKLSTNFSRSDLVINAGSYADLYMIINKLIKNDCISDQEIAIMIRDILYGKTVALSKYDDHLLDVINNITYLLFGYEVNRNPAALIHHQMMLDLIETGDYTWQQVLTGNKEHGGGLMPMSITRESDTGAVAAARSLHALYARYMPIFYRYDHYQLPNPNISHPKVTELIRRENELTKEWYNKVGRNQNNPEPAMQDEKTTTEPTPEVITASIKAACKKWYNLEPGE